MSKKKLQDYAIGNLVDLDFLDIFEVLDTIKNLQRNGSLQDYRKSYVNSLFSPLCSYAIDYLNENKEKPGVIGSSKVSGLNVIYITLNQTVFDLFFNRTRGKIFSDGKNEINYNINNDEENYRLMNIDFKKEYNFNQLLHILSLGEKINQDEEDDFKLLKEVYHNKRKEIISSFRFGYTIQERIMNMFNIHSEKEIKELPNIIFFENNNFNKNYNEIDRVVTVEEDSTISNFKVYYKSQFQNGKKIKNESFIDGEILILPKNSCNFIEVKTSANFFREKKEKENQNNFNFKYKTPSESSTFSYNDNSQKEAKQFLEKMIEFIELFKNINIKYSQINLIIIIDSYYTKDFIELAKKFSLYLEDDEIKQDFNLYFVHIESDIIYITENNKYKQLENSLNDKETKINELDNSLKDKEKKILGLEHSLKDKEKKINELRNNMEAKNKDLNKLNNEFKRKDIEYKDIKKELTILKNKNRKRKIKKKLRNSYFDEYIKEEINHNQSQIDKDKENNYIIGNYQNNSFKNKKKFFPKDDKYNVVIDFQTFLRLNYEEQYKDLIDDIKTKHLKKIKAFSIKTINKIILIVDFVFILAIKEMMEKYFENKKVIIKPIKVNSEDYEEEYLLFLLSFENRGNEENSLILKDSIILYEEIDIKKIININDFISYYYELKKINAKNGIDKFPIYDPLNGKNNIYLYIRKTNCKKGEILILIIDPLYEYENLDIKIYEKHYTYLILLFQGYYFDFSEKKCELFSKYFYQKEKCTSIIISDNISSIIEKNNLYLGFYGDINKYNAAIIDEKNEIVLFKFKLIRKNESDNIEIENYKINVNNIIDKNIRLILDNVRIINKKNFKILIDEPFNIINKYLSMNYKNSKITLISKEKNEIFKNKISTNEENEINLDIITYFEKEENENKKFNLIISINSPIFENINDNQGCIKKEIIKKIVRHLEEKGIFCFYLFLKNKYLMERIEKEVKDIFGKVEIFQNHSYYIFICFNNIK